MLTPNVVSRKGDLRPSQAVQRTEHEPRHTGEPPPTPTSLGRMITITITVAADGSDLTQLTETHREEGFPDWGTAA